VFAERAGSKNGLNVLTHSTLWSKLVSNNFPADGALQFTIGSEHFEQPYLLADGIYPQQPFFVHPIHHAPDHTMQKAYTKAQEAIRKDIERLYGVIKKRFPCLKSGLNVKKADDASKVIRACFVLHNLFIEDDIANGKWSESMADESATTINDDTDNSGKLIEKNYLSSVEKYYFYKRAAT